MEIACYDYVRFASNDSGKDMPIFDIIAHGRDERLILFGHNGTGKTLMSVSMSRCALAGSTRFVFTRLRRTSSAHYHSICGWLIECCIGNSFIVQVGDGMKRPLKLMPRCLLSLLLANVTFVCVLIEIMYQTEPLWENWSPTC